MASSPAELIPCLKLAGCIWRPPFLAAVGEVDKYADSRVGVSMIWDSKSSSNLSDYLESPELPCAFLLDFGVLPLVGKPSWLLIETLLFLPFGVRPVVGISFLLSPYFLRLVIRALCRPLCSSSSPAVSQFEENGGMSLFFNCSYCNYYLLLSYNYDFTADCLPSSSAAQVDDLRILLPKDPEMNRC